jgi:hypothetical protein
MLLIPMFMGMLPKDKMKEFIDYFYDLESSKFTIVEISRPLPEFKVRVTLTAVDDGYLLDASMRDGLLNHKGFSKYFNRLQGETQ